MPPPFVATEVSRLNEAPVDAYGAMTDANLKAVERAGASARKRKLRSCEVATFGA
jgi:hypothetical protein